MSVRKRRDGSWLYDITTKRAGVVLSREKRGGFATARAARDAEHARRAAMLADPRPTSARCTFAELAQEVMTLHVVHNKRSEQLAKKRIFELHLVPAFGSLPVAEIGAREIAQFKASKATTHAAKTVNNFLAVLHKSLALGVEWGRLRAAPRITFLRAPKPEIAFFDFDETARLIAATEPAWRAMVLAGLRAGLRHGELLELRWSDVDLGRGVLRVARAICEGVIDTPKGGKPREVPLSDELRDALRPLSSRFAAGLVWPGAQGQNLTRAACRAPLRRACKRAGVRSLGWHALRHTFASQLVMKGVTLRAVQELLGHADIKTTMRYAHLSPGVTREAVKLLDAPRGTPEAAGAL